MLIVSAEAADKNMRAAAATSSALCRVEAAPTQCCERQECDSLILDHVADPQTGSENRLLCYTGYENSGDFGLSCPLRMNQLVFPHDMQRVPSVESYLVM